MTGLIVHEWVEKTGGAEKVLSQLIEEFTASELIVLWNNDLESFPNAKETWLARTPLRRHKAVALPFMIQAWRNLKLSTKYEWLLVSSHLFAHHATVIEQKELPKFVYAHTPARYIWEPELDQRGNKAPLKIASRFLKGIDKARAQEITAIATNSNFTKLRIENTWQQNATVIYPPVDTEEILEVDDWAAVVLPNEKNIVEALPSQFILGASRFVSYKNLEKVIEAGKILDVPVVLAGKGPEEQRLRQIASASGVKVIFIISPSTQLLRALFQRSLVYVFPAVEDFGIMPVEAIACGTPIVVPKIGGASEIVEHTSSGSLFDLNSNLSLGEALHSAIAIDRRSIAQSSQFFSNRKFRKEISEWQEAILGNR